MNEIIDLIESGKFEEAASITEVLLESSGNDENLWFAYGVCLKNLNRYGKAVDAFIRSWVTSKQTYEDAVSNALFLIPDANPNESLEVDSNDSVHRIAAMLREEFEKNSAND